MSLARFEKTVLTLYTDHTFLSSYATSGASLPDLNEKEKCALEAIPAIDLQRFAKELRVKRIDIAKTMLNRMDIVMLFPVHRTGPALFFKEKETYQEVSITSGMRELFSRLIEKKQPLSTRAVLSAARAVIAQKTYECEPTLGDILQSIRIIHGHGLTGKMIRRTL